MLASLGEGGGACRGYIWCRIKGRGWFALRVWPRPLIAPRRLSAGSCEPGRGEGQVCVRNVVHLERDGGRAGERQGWTEEGL
eukprot:358092-Chlamydomonas_euryale.AAC.6